MSAATFSTTTNRGPISPTIRANSYQSLIFHPTNPTFPGIADILTRKTTADTSTAPRFVAPTIRIIEPFRVWPMFFRAQTGRTVRARLAKRCVQRPPIRGRVQGRRFQKTAIRFASSGQHAHQATGPSGNTLRIHPLRVTACPRTKLEAITGRSSPLENHRFVPEAMPTKPNPQAPDAQAQIRRRDAFKRACERSLEIPGVREFDSWVRDLFDRVKA